MSEMSYAVAAPLCAPSPSPPATNMTGTPEGVNAVLPGDVMQARIAGLSAMYVTVS
jgi:hypothetical protein